MSPAALPECSGCPPHLEAIHGPEGCLRNTCPCTRPFGRIDWQPTEAFAAQIRPGRPLEEWRSINLEPLVEIPEAPEPRIWEPERWCLYGPHSTHGPQGRKCSAWLEATGNELATDHETARPCPGHLGQERYPEDTPAGLTWEAACLRHGHWVASQSPGLRSLPGYSAPLLRCSSCGLHAAGRPGDPCQVSHATNPDTGPPFQHEPCPGTLEHEHHLQVVTSPALPRQRAYLVTLTTTDTRPGPDRQGYEIARALHYALGADAITVHPATLVDVDLDGEPTYHPGPPLHEPRGGERWPLPDLEAWLPREPHPYEEQEPRNRLEHETAANGPLRCGALLEDGSTCGEPRDHPLHIATTSGSQVCPSVP